MSSVCCLASGAAASRIQVEASTIDSLSTSKGVRVLEYRSRRVAWLSRMTVKIPRPGQHVDFVSSSLSRKVRLPRHAASASALAKRHVKAVSTLDLHPPPPVSWLL
ncbi:hypothetical protein CGC21_1365 [Leishmania donovani]|uniref:Uncharacterized protein n=1 Tax=Leishmania donovani TaxID=5661 RepID=A0A504XFP5_LEIDO|nr:hypothetical protein CGC21_1365 [Leishmania donovani]